MQEHPHEIGSEENMQIKSNTNRCDRNAHFNVKYVMKTQKQVLIVIS
jgi:hypothetical protein